MVPTVLTDEFVSKPLEAAEVAVGGEATPQAAFRATAPPGATEEARRDRRGGAWFPGSEGG